MKTLVDAMEATQKRVDVAFVDKILGDPFLLNEGDFAKVRDRLPEITRIATDILKMPPVELAVRLVVLSEHAAHCKVEINLSKETERTARYSGLGNLDLPFPKSTATLNKADYEGVLATIARTKSKS